MSLESLLSKRSLVGALCAALASCGGGGTTPADNPPVGAGAPPAPAPAPAPGSNMPVVNASLIPSPQVGARTARLAASSERGRATGEVAIRFVCSFSHMNFDDPLIFPGQVGRSHLHTFFGNTAITANSNTASIAGSGNSTCAGGILNRSAYWVPSVIDTRTGRPVAPDSMVVYYKANGGTHSQVQPMPAGLRMISGDPAAQNAQQNPLDGNFDWFCEDGLQGNGPTIPARCSASTPWRPGGPGDLRLSVVFQRCWDGRNLDSPDHRSHMAFSPNGSCPSSHPVLLPEITVNVHWPVATANETQYWRLSSDNYVNTIPGGYSSHSDWWNGWDQTIVDRWVTNCLRAGLDCPIANLNDGWALN